MGSISWEGEWKFYDGDYTRIIRFTNEITIVDEKTRQFVEVSSENFSGTFQDTRQTNTILTGQLIEGTSLCKAVAGIITSTYQTNRYYDTENASATISISKAMGDPYWKFMRTGYDNIVTEFLAHELDILTDHVPDNAYFVCDFVDQ